MAGSKFTPEIRAALIERFEAGSGVADAARSSGVAEQTVKTWLTRGRRGDAEYAEFTERVNKARAEARRRVSDPMDAAELLRVASRSARAGSVTAMKLVWEMVGRKPAEAPKPGDPDDPMSDIDELAARRAAGVNRDRGTDDE